MTKAWTPALEAYVLTAEERYALENAGARARAFFIKQCSDRYASLTLSNIAAIPAWAFMDQGKQAHLARICGALNLVETLKVRPDGTLMRMTAKLIGVRALDFLLASESVGITNESKTHSDEASIAIAGYEFLNENLASSKDARILDAALSAFSYQNDRAVSA